MNEFERYKLDCISKSPYSEGDSVTVDGVLLRILDIGYLAPSDEYIYTVESEDPLVGSIIFEGDIDDQT